MAENDRIPTPSEYVTDRESSPKDSVFFGTPKFKRLVTIVLLVCAIVITFAYFNTSRSEFSYIQASIERGDILGEITVTGTVNPVGEVKIGTQLSGQILEVLADFNQEVKRDQPLARLDPATFETEVNEALAAVEIAKSNAQIKEAAVAKAEADLENARDELSVIKAQTGEAQAIYTEALRDVERKRTLSKEHTVSKSHVDRAEAGFDTATAKRNAKWQQQHAQQSAILSAEAVLRMAKAELDHASGLIKQREAALRRARIELVRTVIWAPIDGVVIGRNVEPGQTVAAALEAPVLFTLAQDLRRMEVRAIIDEADIGRIRIGQTASFTVDAFSARGFQGKVVEIRKAPEKVQNVVTYTVLISADNPDLALFPGMTATVRIMVDSARDVLKIPNSALRFRPPNDKTSGRDADKARVDAADERSTVVWILNTDGEPSAVNIQTGATDNAFSELLSGSLAEGQEVIVGIDYKRG